jgi:hypothetical protein
MTNPQPHLDGRNLAIGVLSITACTLFVGFLLVTTLSSPAHAIGTSDRSGDYIIVTQQLSDSQEAVVILDAAAKRLLLYGYDYNRKQLLPLSGFQLDQLRTPGRENVPPPGRGRGP